jgi:hypothetical protein
MAAVEVFRLNDEHDAFEWHGPESAMKQVMWPGRKGALQQIIEEILAAGPTAGHLEIPLPESDRA